MFVKMLWTVHDYETYIIAIKSEKLWHKNVLASIYYINKIRFYPDK
jgi:hypothetical protein